MFSNIFLSLVSVCAVCLRSLYRLGQVLLTYSIKHYLFIILICTKKPGQKSKSSLDNDYGRNSCPYLDKIKIRSIRLMLWKRYHVGRYPGYNSRSEFSRTSLSNKNMIQISILSAGDPDHFVKRFRVWNSLQCRLRPDTQIPKAMLGQDSPPPFFLLKDPDFDFCPGCSNHYCTETDIKCRIRMQYKKLDFDQILA